MSDPSDQFIQALTASQNALYGYILSLLPDRAAAQDVLQEVNLTAWQKREDFSVGTSFVAWASKIAYYHVLSHRRKLARDRLVFDDDVLDYLAERQAERTGEVNRRAQALKRCLEKLPTNQRDLVAKRHALRVTVRSGGFTNATGRSTSRRMSDSEMNALAGFVAARLSRIPILGPLALVLFQSLEVCAAGADYGRARQ